MKIAGKRALVTGGSSGIGLQTARLLLREGARVVITGRRASQLQTAMETLGPPGDVEAVAADLVTPEGRRATVDGALGFLGGLDILVNNAGGVRGGRLEQIEEREIQQMLDIDLAAPILLTRALLPRLRESGDALIVNVSSSIAQVGLPFYATYAAAKAGLTHFGEALRRELHGEGVGVLDVFPVATETPMMATSGSRPAGGRDTPEAVAADIIAAIEDGRRQVVRGDAERLATVDLNRSNPEALDRKLAGMRASLEEQVKDHSAL